jgi:PleD family two-component response regulator
MLASVLSNSMPPMLKQDKHEFQYTVLIIDDCDRGRSQYREFLQQDRRYTYDIIEAGVSNQSFLLLQQTRPDVILLSASTPYLENILEILSYLKLQNDQMNIPVILLIDQEDSSLISNATQRGAYDCLGKTSLNATLLTRSIQSVIERSLLVRQLERSREEQRLIWDIALRIRQSLNLQEVLQAVVHEVRQLLKADRVVIRYDGENCR